MCHFKGRFPLAISAPTVLACLRTLCGSVLTGYALAVSVQVRTLSLCNVQKSNCASSAPLLSVGIARVLCHFYPVSARVYANCDAILSELVD
jgi:hypothetical protein